MATSRQNGYKMNVGDRGHIRLYTDIEPCTVIKVTATTITVRRDKATRDPDFKPEWIPGGFSAICTNDHEQKWIITEDPEGEVETFRWSGKQWCYIHNGCRFYPGWKKYYDYNF